MRARWLAAGAVVGVVFAAVLGVVIGSQREPSGPTVDTLLARVDRFTATSESFSYEATGEYVTGVPGESPFRRVSTPFTSTGAETTDRRRYLTVYEGQQAIEFVQVRRRAVFRVAKDPGALGTISWSVDGAKKDRTPISVEPGVSAYFGANLAAQADAEIIRRDKGMPVLRFTVPPEPAPGFTIDYLDYEAELTVSPGGVPLRLVERHRVRDASDDGDTTATTTDIRFSGWGEPVDIRLPPEAQIEPVSGIDRPALAAYRTVPLLQPQAIPERWVLGYAAVLEANETAEGCRQVELDYVDPDDPDEGYLYLWQFEVACADSSVPPGATEVAIGDARGWIQVANRAVNGQFVFGSTVVQAHTDLPPSTLASILADLVPLAFS
ncbi:MAG: hypothetical protein ACRD12_23270 [Acidimicrobiales bacterium]